jgi:hypothetical protein
MKFRFLLSSAPHKSKLEIFEFLAFKIVVNLAISLITTTRMQAGIVQGMSGFDSILFHVFIPKTVPCVVFVIAATALTAFACS